MKITAFLKWLIGFDDEKPKVEEKKDEGILLGEERRKLVLKNTHRMIESHPRARYAPVLKWEWTDSLKPFYLDILHEVNPHINISGSSGYGKSTLCKSLLAGISRELKIPVTVLDVHNEFTDYVTSAGGKVYGPKTTGLNVWELDGLSPAERIGENMEMFKRILDLGEIQAYNLLKCAELAYKRKGIHQEDPATWNNIPPTMQDITDSITLMLKNPRNAKNQSLLGMSKRLYGILLSNAFSGKTAVPFDEILSNTCSFTLGDLRSNEAQAMFIETFLRKLYGYMLAKKLVHRVGLYILIDEAHKVCISNSKGMSLPGRLVTEGRKYGIGIITSNQMAKALDRSIVGNSAVTFAFHQKEPQEEEYIANLLSGGNEKSRKEEVRVALRYLRQFEAIALTSRHRNPVKIRITPMFAQELQPVIAPAPKITATPKQAVKQEETPNYVRSSVLMHLKWQARRLTALCEMENDMNEEKMQKLISQLEREGLVESEILPNLEGELETWVGTKRGDRSVEHSAYVRMLFELLKKNEVQASIYDSADMPDIVIGIGGFQIALEYETGKKKDDKKTLEMLVKRMEDYAQVIVVTPEENVQRYEKLCLDTGVQVIALEKFDDTRVRGIGK